MIQAIVLSVVLSSLPKNMEAVSVDYWGYDGQPHQGTIVVNRKVVPDVKTIFAELRAMKFPIHEVVPIDHFGGSDQKSIASNNTSGYNYRTIPGSKRLSNHAYGRAIDLNPLQNPWLDRHGKPKTQYVRGEKGKVTSAVVAIFRRQGWKWGGNWKSSKDLQHFEKH